VIIGDRPRALRTLVRSDQALGPKMRTAIQLRDIEERSVKETAELLGSSMNAVKARVFQGRRKLRRMVNRVARGNLQHRSGGAHSCRYLNSSPRHTSA
jgi:DNA-directed RNA polymerase specialized sigma24 family protein